MPPLWDPVAGVYASADGCSAQTRAWQAWQVHPQGLAVNAEDLVQRQTFETDALEPLGYTANELQTVTPGLIDVSLNAYGWSGPWRNHRGFDSLVQMSSGIADAGMAWKQSVNRCRCRCRRWITRPGI